MTPEELEMLFAVFESGGLNEVDLLNQFHGRIPAKDAYEMLKKLRKDGFLHVDQERVVTLGKDGRSLVRQHREEIARRNQEAAEKEAAEAKRLEERREDLSEKKRQKKQDRIFEIFIFLLGFVLGAIADNFGVILNFFKNLFYG